MIFRLIEFIRGWLMPYPFWIADFGRRGEYLARRHYHRKGYHCVARNWRHRRGEIDLIMAHHKQLLFLEVKTRSRRGRGGINSVLSRAQERRLRALAEGYVNSLDCGRVAWRFLLVHIVVSGRRIVALETARLL